MSDALKVVVYVKPNCTLCVPVMETVERVRKDVDFSLEKVDIRSDPDLVTKYAHEVPVVTINGRKAFKGRINEGQLRRKLKRAQETGPDQNEDASGPEVEALEALESPPYVPPRPIALFLVALSLGVFAWFLMTGFRDAQAGRAKLAGELLRVAPRKDTPVHFNLESINGKKFSIDDFRGKVVFLNFWATWCPPCVEEMPSMTRMYQRMKDDPNLVILAVSTDDSWAPVREFFKERELPAHHVLLDPTGVIAKQYGTTMFPETYVIKDGKIVGFIEGPRNWDDWFADEYLKAL
jgi:thiol-disulfide isomerase/thioredoxin